MKFGSLFSGIGGFDLGFERAGLTCEWQVEIDKDCQRVLSKQWPKVKRFEDVSTVRKLPAVDVICGGFPCQDLSVAGKRAGLAGERSGLWFEFLRIIESNKPRFVVIENVPGLLSSDNGRDFGVIVRGLVGVGYCVAWRVLDAQYFGVAQRRRRVFIIGSLGNGSCAEILFESESVSGNPPARGEARSRVAPCIDVSPYADREAEHGRLIEVPSIAWALQERDAKGSDSDTKNGHLIVQPGYIHPRQMRGSESSNQVGIKPDANVTDALLQEGPGAVLVPIVTHALRSEGADASETDVAGSVRTKAPGSIENSSTTIVAFSSKDHGADAGELSPTLRAQNFDKSHINGGGQVAVAFESRVARNGRGAPSDVVPPLKAESGQTGKGDSAPLTAGNFGVRRLTPRECERLQSFPDDWTLYDAEGKVISDSARYRMLGNAVAVNCAEWIGKRIKTA